MKSVPVFLVTAMILLSVSLFSPAFAQPTQVSYTVNLNWFSLQVTYPSEVMPGDTVSVSVQATPKSTVYLQRLTATIYYADATGLHLITSQTLVCNPANGYGFYGTGNFSKNFTVSVPQNATRTSLVALFSETVRFNYYALYYGNGLTYGNGSWYPTYQYGWYPHYSYRTETDDAIAPLSYIKATTPEYVSLQSMYQKLQQQLNGTQAQNQQLRATISQDNATIGLVRQQLGAATSMTQTYQTVALGAIILVIATVVASFFFILQNRTRERKEKSAQKAELQGKINELQTELAASVPREEAERLSALAEELENKLAASNSEVDSLRADIAQLQGKLAESIPKAESETKVNDLETKLSVARRDLAVASATIEDLEEKLSQSSVNISELQVKLSNSVLRGELETVKGELQSKITDLETRLASSVPRSETEELRARVVELEGELSNSVPKTEADTLLEKANRVEAALTDASEKLSSAETRIRDLESRLAESVPKTGAEARVMELQASLSESKSETEELRARVHEVEGNLAQSVPKIEADALTERVNRLEPALTETREKLNLAEARSTDLESKLAESKTEADALKEKIAALESRLAEAEKRNKAPRTRRKRMPKSRRNKRPKSGERRS